MDEKNNIILQPVDDCSVDRPDFMDTVWELLTSLVKDAKQYLEKNATAVLLYLALMGTPVMSLATNATDDDALYRATTVFVVNEDCLLNKAISSLDQLNLLDEDWDGYGAPKISSKAIKNCRIILNQLNSYDYLEIMPTEYGGVQLKKQWDNGTIISCDFGDEKMSYYIEIPGKKAQYFPFLDYSEENIFNLVNAIANLG